MPALPTKIVTDLRPDDAHVQTASTPFDAQDRQKIDTQILGCQQHIADSLLNGTVGTWVRVASTSPTLAAGDVVCLAGAAGGEPTVTLATAAAIAGPGAAYGVVLQAASPGARARIAIDGLVTPSITGLASAAGMVRVSSVGRPEHVATFSTGDYPLGTVSSQGYLTISRGPAIAGSGAAEVSIVGSDDITVTESPAGTFTLSRRRREILWTKPADTGLDTTINDFPICAPFGVYAKFVSAKYVSQNIVSADDTDYVRVSVRVMSSATGASILAAATAETANAGSVAVGTMPARVPKDLINADWTEESPMEPNHYLAFHMEKVGPSGVETSGGLLIVEWEPWVEEE